MRKQILPICITACSIGLAEGAEQNKLNFEMRLVFNRNHK